MQAPLTPAKGWGPGRSAPAAVPAASAPRTAPADTRPPAPKPPPAVQQPMATATAQRRISWNAAALAAFWVLPAIWPRITDLYYDALIALDDWCVDCHAELINAAVSWLRGAATVVFAVNICEALLARPLPTAQVAATATGVGEALARGAKGPPVAPAPRPSPARDMFVKPSVPSPSRATPARGSPFEGRRSVSPFQRASSTIATSPRPFERRMPSTPFSGRAVSNSRTPSLADAFAGRSASRSPAARSPGIPSPGARSDIDDALEVERALEQLDES